MSRDWSKLRKASFRGVPFWVDQESPDVGRRIAVHKASGGDFIRTEDMGLKEKTWQIEAYVAGDAADAAGKALEAACAVGGSAILRMPIDPFEMVDCTGCYRRREKDRNGYIAYSLSFVGAGGGIGSFSSGISILKGIISQSISSIAAELSR